MFPCFEAEGLAHTSPGQRPCLASAHRQWQPVRCGSLGERLRPTGSALV